MEVVVAALLLEDEAVEEALLIDCLSDDDDFHQLFKQREEEGCFKILIMRHLKDNETKFMEYFRVSSELFNVILIYVKEELTKPKSNRVPNPISAEQKLCLTLRFLATGESYRSLAFQFRICHSWISIIVKKTLIVICSKMLHMEIPPICKARLESTAERYYQRWNYPNCCGSIDGKHIRIVNPAHSGSLFYNYKDFFSIVLLALVDDNYRFLSIDVGSYGKESDSGIFTKSFLGKSILNGSFQFPDPKPLPKTDVVLPHVILGDEAFKLTTWMMRPYPKEQSKADVEKAIYNYRHCRARRTCENAFGILSQYFRVFFTPIAVHPETVDYLVTATCIIHNLLRNKKIPCPNEDGDKNIHLPTENMLPLVQQGGNATHEAYNVREKYKRYFCSREGSLGWQMDHVTRID